MIGLMQSLKITVCEDAAEAVAKGYDYKPEAGFLPVNIAEVVVVRKGTEQGNPTVDLILEDEKGQKFVVMVTGALLKSIPCAPVN
jgi:hypothetical protein